MRFAQVFDRDLKSFRLRINHLKAPSAIAVMYDVCSAVRLNCSQQRKQRGGRAYGTILLGGIFRFDLMAFQRRMESMAQAVG